MFCDYIVASRSSNIGQMRHGDGLIVFPSSIACRKGKAHTPPHMSLRSLTIIPFLVVISTWRVGWADWLAAWPRPPRHHAIRLAWWHGSNWGQSVADLGLWVVLLAANAGWITGTRHQGTLLGKWFFSAGYFLVRTWAGRTCANGKCDNHSHSTSLVWKLGSSCKCLSATTLCAYH